MRIACGILLCAALSASRPAVSFGESDDKTSGESGRKTRVFLALFGGPQFLRDVRHQPRNRPRQPVAHGIRLTAKKIGGGTGFGAGVWVWASSSFAFCSITTACRERFELRFGQRNRAIDETVSAPANALTATFGYFRSWKAIRYGIGGGGGYYICNGKVDARIGNTRFSYDLDGKGLGAHALALADIAVSTDFISKSPSAIGPRRAVISNPTARR